MLDLSLFASNLTRLEHETFLQYSDKLITEIKQIPLDNLIAVFPEYNWGQSSIEEILDFIDSVKDEEANGKSILFGSAPFSLEGGKPTNNAILLDDQGNTSYFAKSHPMKEETRRHHLVKGNGPHEVRIKGINVGILICADLWDSESRSDQASDYDWRIRRSWRRPH